MAYQVKGRAFLISYVITELEILSHIITIAVAFYDPFKLARGFTFADVSTRTIRREVY